MEGPPGARSRSGAFLSLPRGILAAVAGSGRAAVRIVTRAAYARRRRRAGIGQFPGIGRHRQAEAGGSRRRREDRGPRTPWRACIGL